MTYKSFSTEAVREKFEEARYHLKKLGAIDGPKDFYPTVNSFLSAGRSVAMVLRYQFGMKDGPLKNDPVLVGMTPDQEAERKRFDSWAAASPELAAVEKHFFAEERHELVHRSGQTEGFVYNPPPGGGLAIEPGTAFGPVWPLPITTEGSTFLYRFPDGSERPALDVCREYLEALLALLLVAIRTPWRG
jgi:hypothetical protein